MRFIAKKTKPQPCRFQGQTQVFPSVLGQQRRAAASSGPAGTRAVTRTAGSPDEPMRLWRASTDEGGCHLCLLELPQAPCEGQMCSCKGGREQTICQQHWLQWDPAAMLPGHTAVIHTKKYLCLMLHPLPGGILEVGSQTVFSTSTPYSTAVTRSLLVLSLHPTYHEAVCRMQSPKHVLDSVLQIVF